MDIFYTNEKVWAAVRILATGRGPIRERLLEAFTHGMPGIGPYAFPEPLASEFERLLKTVTKGEPDKVGALAAIDQLDEEAAVSAARKILEIAYSVSDLVEDEIRRRTS